MSGQLGGCFSRTTGHMFRRGTCLHRAAAAGRPHRNARRRSSAPSAARDPRNRCDGPGAWRWLGLALLANLDTAIGGSDDLMMRDHVKRFVAVLLRLGGCRYATPAGDATIEIDVNQEDLAAMMIIARTTAGALLQKLKSSGHIEAGYRSIRILAPDALRRMLVDSNPKAGGRKRPSLARRKQD